MMSPLQDLLLWSLATYGLAWLWTQSGLVAPFRKGLERGWGHLPLVGAKMVEGSQCLVCAGTWIGLALFLHAGRLGVFSPWFKGLPYAALVPLVGLWVAVGWTLGRHNGELQDE